MSLSIVRLPGIGHILSSALGDLADAQQLVNNYRTVQDVIDRLAELTGASLASFGLMSTGTGANRTIQFAVNFNPDPITLHTSLDFGTKLPGLTFSGSTAVDLTIAPQFHLDVGLRLAPNLPIADRFFIAADATPEFSLNASLQLANPTLAASFGFLDAKLMDDPSIAGNQGILISGSIGVNVVDPNTVANTAAEVTVSELNSGSLSSTFQITSDLAFDIAGLLITADVGGTTTLGTLGISLHDPSGPLVPIHVTSLAQLQALPSQISVTGNVADFSNFTNISFDTVIAALKLLAGKLKSLGSGGVFAQKIPVVNKSLSDLIDLGSDIATKLGNLDSADPTQFATAKGLQTFLTSHGIPLTVTTSSSQISFQLSDSFAWSKTLPLDFNLGSALSSLVSISGNGQIGLSGMVTIGLGFGFLTAGGNLSIPDRAYFDTTQSSISVTANADIGYDLNNNGNLNDPGEGQPLNLTVAVGPLSKSVVQARGLIAGMASVTLVGDANNRLTFSQIAANISNPSSFITGAFTGTAQARIPLDGDNNGTVSGTVAGLSAQDALILIGGNLANLGNVHVDSDDAPNFMAHLPEHTGATGSNSTALGVDDPYTPSEIAGLGS